MAAVGVKKIEKKVKKGTGKVGVIAKKQLKKKTDDAAGKRKRVANVVEDVHETPAVEDPSESSPDTDSLDEAPAAKKRKTPSGAVSKTPEKNKAESAAVTAAAVAASTAAAALFDDDRGEHDELAFSNFRLTRQTLDALTRKGVKALFPIQAATFNKVRAQPWRFPMPNTTWHSMSNA